MFYVILLNSIFVNSDKEYYPQIFLEECKYEIKNRKIVNAINEDLSLMNLMMNLMMNLINK